MLLFVATVAVLASTLIAWATAASLTHGGLGEPPTWLVVTGLPSALYLGLLWIRLDNGRQILEARFRDHGVRLEEGRSASGDWLLQEVIDQCRTLGISRAPNVYVCDPEVFSRGPFAHAGLADEGRVGIPGPWLDGPGEGALRFIVGHELSHVLHRDGFVREAVDTFVMLFLRGPALVCAAFVLFVFAVAIPIAAVVVALTAVLAFIFQDAGPLLAVLAGIPGVFLGIPSIPQVKWALAIMAVAALVGGVLILYRLWVERRQELKADEAAFRAAGAEAAHEGVDLIAWLEGAVGEGPVPITREQCRDTVVKALIGFAVPLLSQSSDTSGVRLVLSLVAWIGVRIGDGLWLSGRVLSRLLGAKAVRHAAWRLTRTHPTPEERKRHIERLLAAQERA